MLASSSGRIALKREGGVAGAPAPRHRNLIHTSLLTALSVHKHGGKKKKQRGHRGLFLKLSSEGEKNHPQPGNGNLQYNK